MPVIRTSSPYTIHGTSSAATFGSSPYLRRSSPTAQSGLLSAFEFADASPRASQDARREIHRRDALEGHEHEILEARRQQKNATPPTAYMKGKGKKLSVDEDIFGVLGGSPSGSTKWPGSQPIASTSKGNLFVKHEDSPPVVSEPSSGTGKKFYRNFQYSGHSLLHPSPDSKGSYDKALELWTPPPIIRLSPVAYEVPASGLEKFEEALLSGEGVPSQEFWNIFERCPTCGRVVYGPKMHMHNICDLTHL
ncbi:hypothetical protein HWV62_36027 [Athelia sp. TMB]|nr:hypothetical protein HWV62_36027 [Athelia sp. TMB]